MRVMKKGKIVDIPFKRGTVVKLRDSNGRLTGTKGIIVQAAPASNFSRAYGREVFVCSFHPRGSGPGPRRSVSRKNASQVYPVGRAKRIPKECREALQEYTTMYPTLGPKKRKR